MASTPTATPNEHTPQEVRAAWVEAARPRTLPLAASGSLIAAGIAAAAGVFRWEVFALMFVVSMLLQVVANFADDYGDLSHGLDDETRVGPKRGLQRGVISVPQMKRALIATCALTFVLGIALVLVSFMGGPAMTGGSVASIAVFVALGLASIAAAIFYTMGKHPYGYIGLGDFMSFLFFGVVAVVGGSFLYLHQFAWVSLVAALALGCPVMAVMNINNMRDAKRDAAKGKRTVANMLGDPAMRVYETVLLAAGAVLFLATLPMLGINNFISYFLVTVSFVMWVRVAVFLWHIPDPEKFDRLMAPTSMGSVLVAVAWLVAVLLGI